MRTLVVLLSLALIALPNLALAEAQCARGQLMYTPELVSPPDGAQQFYGLDMNELGTIAGWHRSNYTPTRATVAGRTFRYDLPHLENDFRGSTARAINNLGQIVGRATVRDIGISAFVHDPINGTQVIDALPSIDLGIEWDLSEALDINDHGEIVGFTSGYSADYGSLRLAWFFSPKTGLEFLTDIDDRRGSAQSINNQGQVIGYSGKVVNGKWVHTAFVWTKEKGKRMLPAPCKGGTSSLRAQNNLGEAVGYIKCPDSNLYQAVRWDENNGYQLFPDEEKSFDHYIVDINDLGMMIGRDKSVPLLESVFLYFRGTKLFLHELLPANTYFFTNFATGANFTNQGDIRISGGTRIEGQPELNQSGVFRLNAGICGE